LSFPIKISANGRYFTYSDGQPFFWQGDTEWELLRYLSLPDADALLKRRRAQGFNVIQAMVLGVFQEWGADKGMASWQGIQPWIDRDPLKPNDAYFQRMDAIVTAAAKLDLVLVVGVYHSRDEDAGRISAATVGPWAKWLGNRYRNAKNIVWSMYPHATPVSTATVQAAVGGLREGDNGAHLVTLHPDPSPTSSSFMHDEPWLSFNTLQTWDNGRLNYDMVATDYGRKPVKPVVNGEARYEAEDGATDRDVRRGAWWSCLAGGFYSYGHRDNWRSPATWWEWTDSPGAGQMQVLGDLFRSLPWWKLEPAQQLFSGSPGQNAAARSVDGDWVLVYLPENAPVSLNMERLSGQVTGAWLDPRSGERTGIEAFSAWGARTLTPPAGWQDAVLLLNGGSPRR